LSERVVGASSSEELFYFTRLDTKQLSKTAGDAVANGAYISLEISTSAETNYITSRLGENMNEKRKITEICG